jgi:integrase
MSSQRQGWVYRRCTQCGDNLTGTTRSGRSRADLHDDGPCGGGASTWSFRVDVSAPGAPRRQRRGGGFATKAEALEAMAELQRGHRLGTAVEPSKLTVGQFLDGWLEVVKATKASATYATRSHHVEYARPVLGDIPLQALTELDVERMAARLAASGGRAGRGLAPRSIADVCTTLTTALNDAVRKRLIPRNVAEGAYRVPSNTSRDADGVFAWTAAELHAWLEVAAGDELWPLWRFLAFTGARRGEGARRS